ncbi:MAG: transglutaminase domain-containing protein [Legionellales bacterium]|nr:transglutaminase domain-containing protein [Legionellales bacterium]
MDILEFYKAQSLTSSPGEYAYLFDSLPDNAPELCKIMQNLFIHLADGDMFNYKIPVERYKEMDSRYATTLLANIVEKDNRPLYESRELKNRVIGICRDQVLLICSALRHKSIPARLRVGFADYFIPNLYLDGIWLEYWDKEKNKWCIVDARTTALHINKYDLEIDFDLYDIPPEKMFSAEVAWTLCRQSKIKANRIGSRQLRGLWYVRNRLIQSLATLNKKEILTWDVWGAMLDGGTDKVSAARLIFFDELSAFLCENAYSIDRLQSYYQEKKLLQVPQEVMVYNPFYEPVSTLVMM